MNSLDGYDGTALLAGAAALQLDPRNAAHRLRLHRLAAVATSLPGSASAKPVSTSKLRKALAAEQVAKMSQFEDPFEGVVVVEVPFYGRSRLVLQGLAQDSGLMAGRVLKAIFARDQSNFPQGFLLRARALATFLLDLSDAICRRAGLPAGTVPDGDAGSVHVPGAAEVARRSAHVQFSAAELFSGMVPEAIDYLTSRLVRQQGQGGWEDVPVSEALLARPLVRSGDTITVAAPGDLATCLRHLLIVEAIEWNCAEPLADSIADQAVDETLRAVGGLTDDGLEVVERNDGIVEFRGVFDHNKVLSAIVLCDGLDGYDPEMMLGSWGEFDAIFSVTREASENQSVASDLQLVITYGIGRDSVFGVPAAEQTPTLIGDLRDFEVMTGLARTHRLSLWYFARALQRLEASTRVMHFSTIDLFQVYREHDNSFYLSDGPPATFLTVEPGAGQESRVEFHQRWGARYRLVPDINGLLEFRPLHGTQTSPILEAWYSPVPICIVERPSGAIEVTASASATDRTFVEAVAYWMWQIADGVPELFPEASLDVGLKIVEESRAGVSAKLDGSHLAVTIAPPSVDEEVPLGGNGFDRLLVKAMIEALDPGGDVKAAVDRVAPAGPKSMLHMLNSARDVLLWPGHLGPATRVDGSVVAELLDSLGAHLTDRCGHTVGPIPSDRRTSVLNDEVVSWYKERLAEEFLNLRSDGLVSGLVEHHEALIRETALEEKILPSRVACFGTGAAEVKKITQHQAASTTSMLASRFLIEYAQKVGTRGDMVLTQSTYERLLAVASEIINKGMLSDSIRFGLSSAKLSVLGSGRLGINQEGDDYSRALGAYAHGNSERVLARALSEDSDEFTVAGPSAEEADALAEEEFGFTYSQLAATCVGLVDIAQDSGAVDVFDLGREELLARLAPRNGQPPQVCARIIDELTLDPGNEEPHDFWDLQSVAPWRFGRPESYLRRPLLADLEGSRLRGGVRAVWFAPQAWLVHMRSGRLQGRSTAMRRAMARLRDEKGAGFEEFVVERLEALGLEQVMRGVRQIAGLNLRSIDGEDLGDIDIVAVDSTRKRVLLLELKNLEVARTPAELDREVRAVLYGPKSAVSRLGKRLSVLAPRCGDVLAERGVRDPRGWKLVPVVVVNEPLMSGSLNDGGVRVLQVSSLYRLVQDVI